jgi:formyltetrahydrofolate deformylase
MPDIPPEESMPSIVALTSCALQQGVAAEISQFVYRRGGKIVDYEQYVNTNEGRFFSRVEWLPADPDSTPEATRADFVRELAEPYHMEWQLHFQDRETRIAIFVTREMAHFHDLLVRTLSGQWNAQVVLMVSNHSDLATEAGRFGIPYHHFPVDKSNREEQEARQVDLLQQNQVDLVVLARYMQIVTLVLIAPFANRIINIHHSMLPAFVGARPYHQAYARGVKLIGATSHYVTEDLDAGPIIAQDVAHVDHRKEPERMVTIGRDLEIQVLARAVGLHVNHRVWIDRARTIVFD